MMDDNLRQPNEDRLALATTALREMPLVDGPPANVLASAEQIATTRRATPISTKLIAASLAILVSSIAISLFLRQPGSIAFADVIQKVNQTRTFTAVVDVVGVTAGQPKIRLSAKGTNLRIEAADSISVFNQTTGQLLQLVPSKKLATTTTQPTIKQPFDLYGMLRDYRTGKEQSLGEKTINGRATQGFRATSDALASESFIIWIDRATKLPVQVEIGPATITELRFDVPLDDTLFDTTIPAGYAGSVNPTETKDRFRFRYAGQVVDERGKPIAGVKVAATGRHDTASHPGVGYAGGEAVTDKDGRFLIDSGETSPIDQDPIRLEFRHPDFLFTYLQDVRVFSRQQMDALHVSLRDGKLVTGRVVDAKGNPVSGTLIQAIYGKPNDSETRWNYAKFVLSDTNGHFELRGLSAAPVVLQARFIKQGVTPLWGQATVDLKQSGKNAPVEIVARPLDLPEKIVHELFGMKFVDVDDALRTQLSLGASDAVLILDAGRDSARFEIGEFEHGDSFWMVGDTRTNNFNEFARQLLAECETQQKNGRSEFFVRVVYNFTRAEDVGSNTQYMRLNLKDLAELQRVVKK